MKIWTEKKLIEEGYEIRNAQIKGAELTMENHGCISFDVVVEGAGWGCVFGGYCRVCENGYEIPSYTIGRDYGCLLNTECESFVKRKE